MTVEQEQPVNKTDDYLYEEALNSLKQLNQEVFLNDLHQQLNEFVQRTALEIADLQEQLKEDISFAVSTVSSVNSAVSSFSDKTQENLGTQNEVIRKYFSDFFSYFNTKLEETMNTAQTSSEKLMENISVSLSVHEQHFKGFNSRHDAFYDAFVKENAKFEQLAEHFKESAIQSIASLKEIRQNWFNSFEEVQADFSRKIHELQKLIERYREFIDQTNKDLTSELREFKRIFERAETIIAHYEQREQSLKDEMKQSHEQFNVLINETIELQQSRLKIIIDELKSENVHVKKELEELKTLTKANQKTSNIFAGILCIMIVLLIALQFT